MKNEQDALDIVSSTVFKAYLNINKLKEPKLFTTWLIRILINTATDQLKEISKITYIDDYEKFDGINSCYYTKPKNLYLVISQLNYLPGAPYTNITPIKIKIK